MGPLKPLALALGVLGAAVGFAACFHDAPFKNGEIACSTDPNRPCPTGSFCIDNYCIHADLAAHDAGADLDAEDAGD